MLSGCIGTAALAQVTCVEKDMEILSYSVGPEDPNPPLWNEKVYPYTMQTDLGDERELKRYRAVILENEYIRVIILPELGGKILAAHDKTNDDFDFIYHNHVVKPGLVALRGAWLSGGIEWNFPTWGHTVNTFSPVNYTIVSGDDGSISCVVGTEEFVRRMKWSVTITLYPMTSYFRTGIRLYNGTLTHNNGYYWSNAATHAWDDTRAVFPPTDYTYLGARRNPREWPILNGVDVSWYTNTIPSSDFFCATPGDFNGSYNYDHENGTVHVGAAGDSPGKKFWTWGYSPRGDMWEKLLTDEDGAYIEVQAGRLISQADAWMFEPHMVEQWDEYWYPVKNMHGFVTANKDVALNLERREGSLFLSMNATHALNDLRLTITTDDQPVLEDVIRVSPVEPFARSIPVADPGAEYLVRLMRNDGEQIIAYSTRKPDIPQPELMPDMDAEPVDSAETRFLRGYYALKNWNRGLALDHFRQALELDPGFTRAHTWAGIVLFKVGQYGKALEHLNLTLKRDEDDYTARYYRALCHIKLGITEHTEMDLHWISRRAAFRHVAPFLLAALSLKKGNFPEAERYLEDAVASGGQNSNAEVMLAAVHRHQGRSERSIAVAKHVLQADPLSTIAALELYLNGKMEALAVIRQDPQLYLEAAIQYAEMHLLEDAVAILKLGNERCGKASPLAHYYQAYYCSLLQRETLVAEQLPQAMECPPDYVFPSRKETIPVLEYAINRNPSDWKAMYYLGNLLAANLQWQKGLEYYLAAEKAGGDAAVLYRNIGVIYRDKLQDNKRAEQYFDHAVRLNPADYRTSIELDAALYINGNTEKRRLMHASVPESVSRNSSYLLSRSQYEFDCGNIAEALAILRKTTFKPWEGNDNKPNQLYRLALRRLSYEKFVAGDYSASQKALHEMMEYPENLGTEKPVAAVNGESRFLLALNLIRSGKPAEGRGVFEALASGDTPYLPEDALFVGAALMESGQENRGRRLISETLEQQMSRRDIAEQHYIQALGAYLLGDDDQSAKNIQQARKLSPLNRKYTEFALLAAYLDSDGE
jgi:uncharacterized protein HemY